MRRTYWVLPLVCLSACASSHTEAASDLGPVVDPPRITAPPITDSAELQAKLLAPADLPTGFTHLEDGSGSNGATTPDLSRTDPAQCSNVLRPVGDQFSGAISRATTSYSDPNFASIDIDAASYADDGAAQAFSSIQQLLRQCTEYSGTDADRNSLNYRIDKFQQPPIGDASAAFEVRTSSQGMSLYSAATLIMVGSSVVQIAESAPQPIDSSAFHDLAERQVHRFKGIQGP